jgi:hypothetical protein
LAERVSGSAAGRISTIAGMRAPRRKLKVIVKPFSGARRYRTARLRAETLQTVAVTVDEARIVPVRRGRLWLSMV